MEAAVSPNALRNLFEEQKDAVLRLIDAQHVQLAMFIESRSGNGAAIRAGLVEASKEIHRSQQRDPSNEDRLNQYTMYRSGTAVEPFADISGLKKDVAAFSDEQMEEFPPSNTALQRSGGSHHILKSGSDGSDKSDGKEKAEKNQRSLLPDVRQLRKQAKNEELRAESDIGRFYKNTGVCQRIARTTTFEYASFLLILANIIWIGIEADYNNNAILLNAPFAIQFFEHFFCTWFLMEICIRFGAFERKIYCFKDRWFWFDSALVIMMVVETWILPITFKLMDAESFIETMSVLNTTRFLRLTRCARLMRLLRNLPEIVILLKGCYWAARSVFFVFVLLAALLYTCGMVFMQLAADTTMEDQFKTVGESMWHLLVFGIFPDFEPIISACAEVSPVLSALMLIFVLFSTLTILNLVVAVTVQTVSVVGAIENEKKDVHNMKVALLGLGEWVSDSEGILSMPVEDFISLVAKREFKAILKKMSIDVGDANYFLETVIYNSEAQNRIVWFQDAVELLSQLRGESKPIVKDLVHLREELTSVIKDEVRQLAWSVTRLRTLAEEKLEFSVASL